MSLNISNLNVPAAKSTSGMLKGCTSLRNLSFAGVATSGVTDMSSMFEGCTSLSAVDIAGLDTSSASNMNAGSRDALHSAA